MAYGNKRPEAIEEGHTMQHSTECCSSIQDAQIADSVADLLLQVQRRPDAPLLSVSVSLSSFKTSEISLICRER